MVRRYQEVDDDTYDDYSRYQQAPRKKAQNPSGRYEMVRPSLRSLQSSMKAKIITVYTNGDKYIHDKPITISFRIKAYPQVNSLLDDIARRKERINKTMVRYLFKWPSGEEVVDVHEISEDDETTIYVCSDVKKLYKQGKYGGLEHGASTGSGGSSKYSRDSRGTVRSEKVSPVARRSQGSLNGSRGQPVNITVISNTNRNSRQSLFLDPKSNQPFESILQNVTDMLEMDYPPCIALYSVKPPYKKADSISSFNRIVPQYGDTFWACGKEGEPIEKSEKSRDSSPMRNGNGQHRSKNGAPKQNGYNNNKGGRDTFEDSQGREFQRYQSQDNQYDDDGEDDYDNQSPVRGSPPRKQQPQQQRRYEEEEEDQSPTRRDNRDNKASKKTPRQDEQDRNKPPAKKTMERNDSPSPRKDDSDDDRQVRNGRKTDDDSDDDERSRDNSPTEEEMKERIANMEEPNDDLDKNVHY